jgi:3-oxoacyl-[acyl-carrier protein] reductase
MNSRGAVAIVTGASGGVGRAVALELAARGYALALLYRSNVRAAEALAVEVGKYGTVPLALPVELTDASACATAMHKILDHFGSVDLLAHCAGAYPDWKSIRELSVDEWGRFIASDLTGFFNILSPCVRHMHDRGNGVVVAVSSIAAQACQAKGAQAAAAKAGLEALVRVLAKEEGRYGIRANAVAIGLTDTEMGADAERHWGAEALKRLIGATPLGRIGKPEEIARAVAFLASDDASYITGKVLQVDGGQIIAG